MVKVPRWIAGVRNEVKALAENWNDLLRNCRGVGT